MQTEALRAPLRQVAAQLCPDVPKLLVGNVEMLNIKKMVSAVGIETSAHGRNPLVSLE
jgi:hypothetical protein